MANSDCTEWMKAQVVIESAQLTATSTTRACRRNIWKRPPNGWIKCNYDGAYKDTTRAAGLGWIFRDADGIYLGAGNAKMNATQALEGEVKALIMAMQHAWSRGYTHVIFEGDCKGLVDLITRKKISFGMYNYIREVWKWEAKFNQVDYQWISRQSNQPADLLATKGYQENKSFQCFNYIPTMITNAVHHDYIISII